MSWVYGMRTEIGSQVLFMTANTGAMFPNFPIWTYERLIRVMNINIEIPEETIKQAVLGLVTAAQE